MKYENGKRNESRTEIDRHDKAKYIVTKMMRMNYGNHEETRKWIGN